MLELIGRAQAQFTANDIEGLLDPFRGIGTPTQMIVDILNLVLFFGGALAIGYLVYGGILYITAGGDAEKATKGKTAVVNAIIGIVIILLALVIITWVRNFTESGTR